MQKEVIPPIVALVPMKEHSERVPNKNIRDFNGRPLFHWILETLTKVECIERIVIDTDGKEIAKNAKENFEVTIVERPERLRGDFMSMNRILEYDLSLLPEYEYFLQTHCTNPLLTSKTIRKAIKTFFSDQEHDSLFSVTRIQSRLYEADGKAINHDPRKLLRTQDLPPVYEENSNIYLFSRHSFNKMKQRIGQNPIMFETDRTESTDIDEKIDFYIAESVHRLFLEDKRI